MSFKMYWLLFESFLSNKKYLKLLCYSKKGFIVHFKEKIVLFNKKAIESLIYLTSVTDYGLSTVSYSPESIGNVIQNLNRTKAYDHDINNVCILNYVTQHLTGH